MTQQVTALPDEASAISRAALLTGLDRVSSTRSATKVTIADDTTPFLSQQIIGRHAWRIDFGPGSLLLKSAVSGFRDRYPRNFSVFLEIQSGRLLAVRSRFKGAPGDMRPEPPAASGEEQLSAAGAERYVGFPTADPKITFLDAVDAVPAGGIGSPFLAKEIDGTYVMDSSMGAPARAVWMVTLRGIPPIPAFGTSASSVSEWQLNHIRNAVDHTNGKVLFSTDVPQPD